MKQGTPFYRSRAVVAAISTLLGDGYSLHSALAQIPAYVSRGKGKGKYSGKKRGNKTGRTYAANGKRECARRVRQMASGQLSFINK